MSNAPTITIPRLENERAERYEARTLYVTMGANRSLALVGQRLGKSTALMERWSSQDNWAAHAETYDNQVAFLTIQEAQAAHRAAIEDYRKRYGDMGKAIYGNAAKLLARLNKTVDTMPMGPGALATITNAVKMAADLEALALRLDHLLETDHDEHRTE